MLSNNTLIDLDHISGDINNNVATNNINKDILLNNTTQHTPHIFPDTDMFINTANTTDFTTDSTNDKYNDSWLDNMIVTPISMSTTSSSTSLESPISLQQPSNNNNNNHYSNYTNTTLPLSLHKQHNRFQTIKFEKDSITSHQNTFKIKTENFDTFNLSNINTTTKNSTTTKPRRNRKRLTQHQKDAHNRTEKRYRININTKIAKLQQIIPWVASEDTAFEVSDTLQRVNTTQDDNNSITFTSDSVSTVSSLSTSTTNTNTSTSTNTASSAKLNKSMILDKAVDYILYLQNNQNLYELEVQRLRNELDSLRNSINNNHHNNIITK